MLYYFNCMFRFCVLVGCFCRVLLVSELTGGDATEYVLLVLSCLVVLRISWFVFLGACLLVPGIEVVSGTSKQGA